MNRSYWLSENGQSAGNIKYILYIEDPQRLHVIPLLNLKNRVKIQSNYSRKTISKLNLDYATVFSLAPYMNENVITIVGICLLIGAMAKSSQVGLHVWLPMAMEGPTPVSALIHAATMVTAGVYLLMRSSPLIEYSSTVLMLCLWLGAITTVFSSLIGLFQQDIKKVIAYSTMSQLGMMVIAVGLSSYNIALFHLVNHASSL